MIRGMRTVWNLDDDKATLLIQQGCSVIEVAERLGVSRQAVYVAIRRGRVPAPIQRGLGDSSIEPDSTTPQPAA